MNKLFLLSWLLAVFANFALGATKDDIDKRLIAEIERLTAEIANGPKLKLPPAPADDIPPESIRAAGENFVKAWQIWKQVATQRPNTEIKESDKKTSERINASTEYEIFHSLLLRTIEADPPVEPEEYNKFTYSDLSWCGDGTISFLGTYQRGFTLSLLKKGRTFHALQNLSDSTNPSLNHLLKAYQIDPEEFAIGAWLGRRTMADKLCVDGGEKTAAMILRWMESQSGSEKIRIINKDYNRPNDEPFFPRTDVIQLLRSGNTVSDETKARISHFIETQGLELYPAATWIGATPAGAEKWMVGLAEKELQGTLNRTRKRASKILTAAGIPHEAPELRPAPLFKISVNGVPWKNDRFLPGMSIDYGSRGAGSAFRLDGDPSGLATTDPDHFFEGDNEKITNVEIYQLPGTGGSPLSPHSSWLYGKVPFPPKFGAINDVDIITTKITIKPQFPWFHSPAKDDITEIEFDRQSPGHTPDGSMHYYHIKGSDPLVIDHVSPGGYWLRVRHPGTALMTRIKISVSKDNNKFQPKMKRGATLVVPVKWPEGKIPQNLPSSIAKGFNWGGETSGYLGLLELWRNGERFKEIGPVPTGSEEKFPHSAIFANLPPGSYEVRLPAVSEEAKGSEKAFDIKAMTITAIISQDSPSFVTSDPLTINFNFK